MKPPDEWQTFLRRCLMNRVDEGEFQDLSKLLSARYPIADAALLDILLESQDATDAQWDPLLPLYVDVLLRGGRVKASAVLGALLKHSSVCESPLFENHAGRRKKSTLMVDVKIIQNVMLSVSTGSVPRSLTGAASLLSVVADWIQTVLTWSSSQAYNAQQDRLLSSSDAASLFESLGILLALLVSTGKGVEVLSTDSHETLKIKLGQTLSAYLPACVQVSLPLRNRLDALQKELNLYEKQEQKPLDPMIDGVNVNALQLEAMAMNGSVINSRAALYIYVNAMLVGRPLVDDCMMINYLGNRYAGQYEVLIEELVTAGFDVLSNGVYRNESSQTMFLFRSFLVNKLPSFFAAVSAAVMVSLPMEMCITQALNRLDPNAFPSFSQMFSMHGSSVLSDVRQEFLFACASHALIQESSIERLLGENPMQTLPVGGPYIKNDLASQINANHERAEQLISELEAMEGNAGAIAGAITDVIYHLCTSKESMTLRSICNTLSRRPQAIDTLLLFRSTRQVLQPLCNLLDTWRWDEDQSESQPVYDEFGSILLLVLAMKYRYDLRPYDLGISSNESFVLKLLDYGSCAQKLEDLNEKQNKHLGAWIGALFIAEGISEETMSSCSPHEFYLLVMTLFDQSLSACEAGRLEFDTLKGGFEYLLEPFLLPSLVIALSWLGNRIWESDSDPTIPLKTLQALVSPSSISGEAQAMHRTVLSITARSIESQLKDVRRRHPSRTDIKSILDVIEPYLSFQRTGSCHSSELEGWTAHADGGLLGSIRSTLQSLVLWSQNPEISMAPHPYTHRQLLAGVYILGATRVLAALIEEVKLLSEAGSGDLALDIATAMICAPMAESFAADQNTYYPASPTREAAPSPPFLTLREALALQHENVSKIVERDALRAELIVRLHRRVNTITAQSPHIVNLNISDIVQNMQLGAAPTRVEVAQPDTGADIGIGRADDTGTEHPVGDEDRENINRMFDDAAAGISSGAVQEMGLDAMGTGMDTSIDDVLNAADMVVGNPEFSDLDMEGLL